MEERQHGAGASLKRIVVPERGSADIDRGTWNELWGEADFRRLVDHGIVTASLLTDGARLRGNCYVGHAICGECRVEIHEKVRGALVSLVRFAGRDTFEIAVADAQATELGPLLRELIGQFLILLGKYLGRGRQFTYLTQKKSGSLAGGRLDIVRTLGLRARGLSHLLAFDMPQISFSTPVNVVIAATLREIERVAELVELDAETIATARCLSLFFSDCRDYRVLVRTRRDLANMAGIVAANVGRGSLGDMLSIGRVILSHQSFEPERFVEDRVPRTWFVNLEALFEEAVRTTLGRLLHTSRHQVLNGRDIAPPIFNLQTRLYRANPDIVIRTSGEKPLLGDVKYKDFEGNADAGDLYQLLGHAGAFDAERCFLVYPSDRYSLDDLGETHDGKRAYLATIDVRDLPSSLGELVRAYGLLAPTAIAA